jgi:hypothetical protein
MTKSKNANLGFNSKKTAVLSSLRAEGTTSPHYCFQRGLSIAGNCRACHLETSRATKPSMGCGSKSHLVGITTLDYQALILKRSRESGIESLLLNHPIDCTVCDQGAVCDLQDQTYSYGPFERRFFSYKKKVRTQAFGSIVRTSMHKCIYCTRCARFLSEVAGVNALAVLGRGETSQLSNYLQQTISSELSGNLITLCPVGRYFLEDLKAPLDCKHLIVNIIPLTIKGYSYGQFKKHSQFYMSQVSSNVSPYITREQYIKFQSLVTATFPDEAEIYSLNLQEDLDTFCEHFKENTIFFNKLSKSDPIKHKELLNSKLSTVVPFILKKFASNADQEAFLRAMELPMTGPDSAPNSLRWRFYHQSFGCSILPKMVTALKEKYSELQDAVEYRSPEIQYIAMMTAICLQSHSLGLIYECLQREFAPQAVCHICYEHAQLLALMNETTQTSFNANIGQAYFYEIDRIVKLETSNMNMGDGGTGDGGTGGGPNMWDLLYRSRYLIAVGVGSYIMYQYGPSLLHLVETKTHLLDFQRGFYGEDPRRTF